MSDQGFTQPAPIVPALRRLYEPLAPYGYAFIRICTGLYLIRHGYPKLFEGGAAGLAGAPLLGNLGFTPPIVWAWIVTIVEVFGGLCLVVGFMTRLAAALLVVEFSVIVFAIKWANGFVAFAPKAIQPGFAGMIPGGFELELLLGLICVAILFRGGERLSLDGRFGREL